MEMYSVWEGEEIGSGDPGASKGVIVARTTVTIDKYWKQAVEKAGDLQINMSQVVRALIKAWVQGDVNVEIRVVQTGSVVVEVEADEAEQELNPATDA